MLGEPEERIFLEARRHGVVLAGAFVRALALAASGALLLVLGWPLSVGAPVALAAAALVALAAALRWERTRVVVTSERLYVVHGVLRRRSAAVRLSRVGAIELDQGLLGRLLGYGTLVAGELEIPYVPEPRQVHGVVERLCG